MKDQPKCCRLIPVATFRDEELVSVVLRHSGKQCFALPVTPVDRTTYWKK